jgi:hypothetical protein
MALLPEKIIDFHVHLFPDKLFRAIWAFFRREYNWNIIHRYYYEECIRRLTEGGVDTIVYSNYAHCAGVAEDLNCWNEKVLAEHNNLYCFAAFIPMIKRLRQWPKGFWRIRACWDSSCNYLSRISIRMMKDCSRSTKW